MNKIKEISYCRIIAMLFILVCHIIKYYQFIPLHNVLGSIFNVGVEIFLIISGYLYGIKNIDNWKDFYQKRYLKILLPVQIWAILLWIFNVGKFENLIVYFINLYGLIHINKNIKFNLKSVGMGHTWFITIIFICYLILPLLQKCKIKYSKKKNTYLLMLLWAIAFLIGLININVYYIPLFITGYYISTYNLINTKNKYKKLTILTILSFVAIFIRLLLNKYIDGSLFYNNIIIPICMSVLALEIISIIFILYNQQNLKKYLLVFSNSSIFQYLDKYSYYIFIVHYISLTGKYNLFNSYNTYYATILFIIFIIVSSYILCFLTTNIIEIIINITNTFIKKEKK